MDEKYLELIDKYLRNEMPPKEKLNFEQEALNNPELRKEIELTYRIKRSLTDRKQNFTKQLNGKERRNIVLRVTL